MSNDAAMHIEHRKHGREHAEWLRDISHWRVDHRKALSLLARVQSIIYEMDAEMEAHAAAIRDHHLEINHHETEMKHDFNEALDEKYGKKHQSMSAMHADVRQHHDALRERNDTIMADFAGIFDLLTD